MSKQRYIKDSFWTDSYIESLSPDYKLVFLYLLTNPQMNIAGVYEIRTKRVAFETGYDVEVIENILSRFQDDFRIIYKDNWIILVNFFKHLPLGEKTAEGVNRIIKKAPESIRSFFSIKEVENTKGNTYSVLVLDTPYIPHTYPSVSDVSSKKLVVSSKQLEVEEREEIEFEDFWKTYPIKKNKKKARSYWEKLSYEDKEKIIQDVPERKTKDKDWLRGAIPHPTTYLNGQRWEDEIEIAPLQEQLVTVKQVPQYERVMKPDGSFVMVKKRFNTSMMDKARAYDKKQQEISEDRERSNNAKHNDKVREMSDLSKQLAEKMSTN